MQKKMTKRRKALRRELKGLAFVAPAFIGLLVFTLYPMVNAVINSLYNWNMGCRSAKKFVGLYNYRKLFRNDEIYLILSNTLRYVLYILPFILVFGFLLGVLLQKKSKLNVVFRTLIYTPHVASMVGLSVVWLSIFNPQYGVVNSILKAVGLESLTHNWLMDTTTAFPSVTMTWLLFAGYTTTLVLAEALTIDDSVLEAARVDGATSFQTDMFVVLPLLRKIIGTTMVMAATYMLQMFDLIYITTKGGPGSTTMNLPLMLYSVYKNENNYGYSNAIGVCIVIAGVVCMTLINKAMRVNEEDY